MVSGGDCNAKLIKIALKSDPPSPSNGNASVWPKTRGSPSARPRFRNYLGPDRILWESEFPRSTSTYPETARIEELGRQIVSRY
jgi:hypothetical protein